MYCLFEKTKMYKKETGDGPFLKIMDTNGLNMSYLIDFQFDPPDDPKEYIHRVGRTARGEGGQGHALLILRPEELGFLRYLRQANVPLNEFEFSWNKVADIQPQVNDGRKQTYIGTLLLKKNCY